MKCGKISDMHRGWFVGYFSPTMYRTKDVEVAVKYYQAGDSEASHHHRIATELTVVVSGEIEMNGVRFTPGDIVTVEPGEICRFEAISDAVSVVVKLPGASDDKYVDEIVTC